MFGLADKDLLRKYEKLDLMIFNIGESVRELEAKNQTLRNEVDRLNHRIELLELRLNGADKQAKAQPTKGAKR